MSGASTTTTGALTKTGAGTLTLSANQTFTGDALVSSGTLVLDYATANGSKLSDSGYLTLAGGTLTLAGGSHEDFVYSTDVTGISTISRSSGTATVNLGFITRTGSNTLNILGSSIARTAMSNDVSGKLPSWIMVNGGPSANDGSGNIAQAVRTVRVRDLTAPLINLVDADTVNVPCGTPYVDAGATVTELCGLGGNTLLVTNNVDHTNPGTYSVVYNIQDQAGNNALAKTRTVIVEDILGPVIDFGGKSAKCSRLQEAGRPAASAAFA